MKQISTYLTIAFFVVINNVIAQDIQIFNITNTSTFTSNNFKCIGIGKDGYIWAGTQYQGLYTYSPNTFSWSKSADLTNVFINDIKTDKNGGIWIAQSGLSGGGSTASNSAGGVNYYSGPFASTQFYSFTPTGGLASRNARAIWIDTSRFNTTVDYPRVWAVQQSFITGSETKAGGISSGLNVSTPSFSNVTNGLQVTPFVTPINARTPSCISIGGDKNEMWVGTIQNFSKSQILRYQPSSQGGTFLGAYDNTNVAALPAGFRANAIYFDNEGRQWVGLSNGGVVVKNGAFWKSVNMAPVFTPGAVVNLCAITGDDIGNIYIGTSAGLIVYSGGAVDSVSSYQLYTTSDGMPSNNITHLAYDNKKARLLIASDAGVAFWSKKKKIDVELVWDNSFPAQSIKPKGVAADGVSRLYFKVKRGNDTMPAIKKVEVSLKDYDAAFATLRGKLKKADTLLLNQYTTEASTGTSSETSRTDSTKKGEFWFWYVSPEDFSISSTSPYASLTERKDSVKIKVTYSNDTKDSVYLDVRVVRPPLVLVHGLASSPAAWDPFKNAAGTAFVNNDLYKYRHAMQMDGRAAFIDNAKKLVAGDIALGEGTARLSTLQGNIEEMRAMGFAANQVYYVCHSMGGIMARSVIRWYADKFYANGGYKYNNYGKGFIHKLITINTPHNGAVPGDLIGEFIPQAPTAVNIALNELYLHYPDSQIPFDFIVPDQFGYTSKYGPSPAVANLSVAKKWGGKKMVPTNVRYHMIVGDVQLVPAAASSLLSGMDKYVRMYNYCLEAARALSPEPAKTTLTGFLRLGQIAGAFTFMEWAHTKNNFPGYFTGSDLIVPLMSETARQLDGSVLHITKFTGGSAWHSGILGRTDVGQRVQDLLNTKVSSNFFSDIIPGNNDPEPLARPLAGGYNTITTNFDTSKVVITSALRNSSTYADSIININFRLKDTVGLAYVRIHFQNTDSVSFARTASQTVAFTVTPDFGGTQKITATAVYDRPDSTKYYIDTLSVSVGNNAALQGFMVNNHSVEIIGGSPYYPSYSVKYNNVWVPLSSTDTNLVVTIDPPGILNFDSSSFNVVQAGFAQAYITYKGFKDTVSFNSEMPLYSNCVNKTIASGSFKNPAIWSKGVVPDLCDSIVINTGHSVTADTSVTCAALRISSGATFTMNSAAVTVQLGAVDEAIHLLDNFGTLNISNGKLSVSGRVKLNASSTFNMSGGDLVIDGNTGSEETSLPDNIYLFDVSPSLTAFSFTGGNLQVTDPPYGANSQAINCSYIFGVNSVLKFGNGISTTQSSNTNGFGGNHLPSQIGNFILDAGTLSNNRIFINLSPLTVKKSLQVKSGKLIQSAPLNVTQ